MPRLYKEFDGCPSVTPKNGKRWLSCLEANIFHSAISRKNIWLSKEIAIYQVLSVSIDIGQRLPRAREASASL